MTHLNRSREKGLLVRLTDAYRHNGEGQPCEDAAEDIAKEVIREYLRKQYILENIQDLKQNFGDAISEEMVSFIAKELSEAQLRNLLEGTGAMDSLLRAEQAALLLQIIDKIWKAARPRLCAGALSLALGRVIPVGVRSDGVNLPVIESERDLAAHQNVSPEHVSQLVEEWQAIIGLPKTHFQKSAKAVAAARLHNQTRKNKEAA